MGHAVLVGDRDSGCTGLVDVQGAVVGAGKPMIPDFLRVAVEEAALHLTGFQPGSRCLAHVELILKANPQRVVEIGVYGGRSLIPQALALKHLGNGGKIYGIDPWRLDIALAGVTEGQRPDWSGKDFDRIHAKFIDDVYAYGVQDYVVPIRAKSQDARGLFADGSIDVLHIDGSHESEAAARDVRQYVPRVKHGGYVWLDDSDFKSTQQAVGFLDVLATIVKDYGSYRLYQVP